MLICSSRVVTDDALRFCFLKFGAVSRNDHLVHRTLVGLSVNLQLKPFREQIPEHFVDLFLRSAAVGLRLNIPPIGRDPWTSPSDLEILKAICSADEILQRRARSAESATPRRL